MHAKGEEHTAVDAGDAEITGAEVQQEQQTRDGIHSDGAISRLFFRMQGS